MKKWAFLFIIFLSFFSNTTFAAPQKSSSKSNLSEERNFIVAKINNKAITNFELLDRYRFVVVVSKMKIESAQDKKLLLNQVLDKMIDEELIRQDAQNLKFEVNSEEINRSIEIVANQQKKTAAQFKAFFGSNNFSYENYLKQVESEVLWSKIISDVMRSKVKVTEVEVRELFEQHKYSTDVKQFLISEILISQSENAVQLANKLVIELKQGADFKSVVRQFSNGVSAENDGEIGWVSQRDVDPKIYNAISKLQKNGYSDPVQLADGYHIFKLLDSKTQTKIADQDMNAARNMIFGRKLQSVAKGYMMDLRKKAFIETNLN
jgi:peptidyl-prolyl cis-trans isomerase SurA